MPLGHTEREWALILESERHIGDSEGDMEAHGMMEYERQELADSFEHWDNEGREAALAKFDARWAESCARCEAARAKAALERLAEIDRKFPQEKRGRRY